MRIVALILLFLIRSTASSGQSAYSDLTTIKTESEHFTDSLIANGVDTVVSYYFGYASCPTLSQPFAFVYWAKNNIPSMVIFKEITRIRKRKRYTGYETHNYLGAGIPLYSFYYFDKNFTNICQDSLIDHSNLYIFDYPFEDVRVKVANKDIKISIKSTCREDNLSSYKIAFIDDFRLFMLSNYFRY